MAKAQRSYTPKPGTNTAFVHKHMNLDASELAALAVKRGYKLTPKLVHVYKTNLRKRGLTHPPSKRPTAARPAKHAKSEGIPRPAEESTPMHPKEAAFRKLIFELGFDIARRVFEEFEELHRRMP